MPRKGTKLKQPIRKATNILLKRSDFVMLTLSIFLIGIMLGTMIAPPNKTVQDVLPVRLLSGEHTVALLLPAVDANGNGVVGTLHTTVKPGTGQVLVNVDNVLSNVDTQLSGRVAAQAASILANTSLTNIDIIYSLDVNASIIEGPSAGAAMAVSIVLALEGKTPKPHVFITGTINKDGSIGQVGGIEAKALVAKDQGGSVLLIPEGQQEQNHSERVRKCRVENGRKICTVTYKPLTTTEFEGIELHPVKTLAEAVAYFSQT